MFRHRFSDRRVEASVQDVEFLDRNRRILPRASSVIAWQMSP
jgi:hypothetical protein